jgi:hypothetical protein
MKMSGTALETALLPQYSASPAFMERFLVAAHTEGSAIQRSPNNQRIKLVDGSELSGDALNYFLENIDSLRAEFVVKSSRRSGTTVNACVRPGALSA